MTLRKIVGIRSKLRVQVNPCLMNRSNSLLGRYVLFGVDRLRISPGQFPDSGDCTRAQFVVFNAHIKTQKTIEEEAHRDYEAKSEHHPPFRAAEIGIHSYVVGDEPEISPVKRPVVTKPERLASLGAAEVFQQCKAHDPEYEESEIEGKTVERVFHGRKQD